MLCPCLTPRTLALLPWPLHAGTAPGELKCTSRQKLWGPIYFLGSRAWHPKPGCSRRQPPALGMGDRRRLAQAALLAQPWLPGAQRRVPAMPIAPVPFTGTGRAEQGAPGPAAGVQAGEKGRLLGNIPLELR